MPAAVDQHPYFIKGLFVDQRFMGVFNHYPVFTILL